MTHICTKPQLYHYVSVVCGCHFRGNEQGKMAGTPRCQHLFYSKPRFNKRLTLWSKIWHSLTMFNILQRGQSVLNFSLTLVGFISAFVAISSWGQLFANDAFSVPSTVLNINPTATMKFSRRFGSTGGKSKENNKLVFDLETDLTPLFNWNTKQVFVYLTAEYPGQTENSTNKVTYWDKIIQSKDKAKLKIKNERSKYSAWDVEPTFNNKEATVKLEWNIQPWVGPLVFGETAGESILTYPSPPEGNKEKLRKEKKNKQN